MFLKCLNSKGERKTKAMAIRNAATSSLENAISPCFIKMKELPQTKESIIKMNQEEADCFTW